MPGTIKGPSSLVNPWTTAEVMQRDDNAATGGDGYLTLDEVQNHLDRLSKQRSTLVEYGSPTSFIDARIADSRELKEDMIASNASAVQYLPDQYMTLPLALRKRVTELLQFDDIGSLGKIDQFVINHARERYNDMLAYGSPATNGTGTKALQEIKALATALGLD